MDNLLRIMRQRNIFGNDMTREPDATPSNMFTLGSVTDDNDYDAGARMNELYQPQHEMTDRYRSALDSMPVRNNPGIWRRMLGFATALGGDPQAVDQALYTPYYRNLADWQAGIKPLQEGANLERQNNANMRAIANQIVSQEQSSRRLERQYARDKTIERQGDVRLEQGNKRLQQGDERLAQADARLEIARDMAKGGTLKVDDAGNAMMVFKDGSSKPVDGRFLSFEEKENAKAQAKAAAGTGKKDRVVERIIQDPNDPSKTMRVSINLDTGEATPITVKGAGSTATPPGSNLEQGRGTLNRAQEVKNSNPKFNKWIKIDKGRVAITAPGIFSGPSQEEYNQMYSQIFGAPPATTGGKGGGSGRGSQPQTQAGRVRVIGPNGQTGTVSAEEAKKLPNGWRAQ